MIKLFLVGRTVRSNFGSDLWATVATFFRSRILKVTVPMVTVGAASNFVTTAKITRTHDNRSRFEVGVELPQDIEDSAVAEGRGKSPVPVADIKTVHRLATGWTTAI
jgi:hypothetical protein